MSDVNPDRRSALATLVAGGVALISAALAGLVAVVAAPATPRTGRVWRRVGSALDLPADAPMSVVIAERHADGWYQTSKQSALFVDRDASGYRALSATCAHLGCRVHWEQSQKQFVCPCHGGVYDRDGKVVAGPPPRGLERLNVRVNPQTSDLEVEL
jgi:Rieske Fe-S protein